MQVGYFLHFSILSILILYVIKGHLSLVRQMPFSYIFANLTLPLPEGYHPLQRCL